MGSISMDPDEVDSTGKGLQQVVSSLDAHQSRLVAVVDVIPLGAKLLPLEDFGANRHVKDESSGGSVANAPAAGLRRDPGPARAGREPHRSRPLTVGKQTSGPEAARSVTSYLGERDSEERGGLRGEGEVVGHAVLSLHLSARTTDS